MNKKFVSIREEFGPVLHAHIVARQSEEDGIADMRRFKMDD